MSESTEKKTIPANTLSMLKRAQQRMAEAKKLEFVASASYQELIQNIAQEFEIPEGASVDMETGEIVVQE